MDNLCNQAIIYNFIANQNMSKLRNLRQRLNQSLCDTSSDRKNNKSISFFGSNTLRSKYIPEAKTAITDNQNINESTQYKDKLFNKNISMFRDSFINNDPSQLPFMCSLRTPQIYRSEELRQGRGRISTACQPFEAGEKSTKNLKFRKRITDLHGKGTRISTAYYRWHNRSGVNTKQSTNFECSLRDYNKTQDPNPEETNFINTIKPIKYEDTEIKVYNRTDLICSRQKKLFCLS